MNQKKIDSRIERAYRVSCVGVQINIMDISKVFTEGRRLIDAGINDIELAAGLRRFVDKL